MRKSIEYCISEGELNLKIIDKQEFLKLREEDSIALSLKTDEIYLKAEIEYNYNQEEEPGQFRINEYSWSLPRDCTKSIRELVNEARSTHCGGIGIFADDNAHSELLEYTVEPPTILLFESTEEQKSVLPILANGEYIFIIKRSDNDKETEEYREYVNAITLLGMTDVHNITKAVKSLYICNPRNLDAVKVFNVAEPLFEIVEALRRSDACPKCGGKNFFKSDLPQYQGVCADCDENFY